MQIADQSASQMVCTHSPGVWCSYWLDGGEANQRELAASAGRARLSADEGTRRPLLAAWACCARRFSGLPLHGRRKGSYGNYHATGEAPVRHARAARAARALRLIEEPRLATVSDFGEPHGPKVDSGP